MPFDISEFQSCVVITLSGNVSGGTDADVFREELHMLADQGKKEVVVDVSGVAFMDSTGLGMLIGGLTTLRNAGGDLRLAGANRRINRLLTVTNLFTVFNSYGTLEEAVKSYQ